MNMLIRSVALLTAAALAVVLSSPAQSASAVPGRIEAEDYDPGGEGVAYHDTTGGNAGGFHRTDDVDIWRAADTGGGFMVGATPGGEWLQYTLNVASAGQYTLNVRVATPVNGKQIRILVNGADVTGPMAVPNTGGWQNWQTLTRTINLAAGQQVMRLQIDSGSVNINWIEALADSVPPPPPPPSSGQDPYGGTPRAVPGRIEAEDYDLGGEGVAYHDTSGGNAGASYRSDDVDIWGAADTGGGHMIGATPGGEWLEYTLNVAAAGQHTVNVRVATPANGKQLRVLMNGADVTGPMAVPNTGGWQTWQTISKAVSLAAGQQVMRLQIDTGSVNVNWIETVANGGQPPPPPPPPPPSVDQYPYGGTAWAIPGKIQAEDYDAGGPGISWQDSSSGNAGGLYRDDDVDIWAASDAGGGFLVGATPGGEWLEYTVDVAAAGQYTLNIRAATAANGKQVRVLVGGTDVSGPMAVPNTGGWQNWGTVSKAVNLAAGEQVMRLQIDTGSVNVNWISVEGQGVPAPASPSAFTAYASAVGQIDLGWKSDASLGQVVVERAPDENGVAGVWSELGRTSGSGASFSDTTVSGSVWYWYQVYAETNGNTSARTLPLRVKSSPDPLNCHGGIWQDPRSGQFMQAGLGLREPTEIFLYGAPNYLEYGRIVLPECPYITGLIRIPVLMVDWADFDPAEDPSNEGNPASTLPGYVKATPEQLSTYLNDSQFGPRAYFRDASGGRADIAFDVYGWLDSSRQNSYIKLRADYVSNNGVGFLCDSREVFLDAVRESIVSFDVDYSQYDSDGNGVVDGAVLVYEGHAGLCSGTNVEGLTLTRIPDPPRLASCDPQTQVSSCPPRIQDLVEATDPNEARFASQQVRLNLFNNIPEQDKTLELEPPAIWDHELGHLLMGFPDYYSVGFNWPWALSNSAFTGNPEELAWPPAPFEKWMFAHWIEPMVVSGTGVYTIGANEIPDGTDLSHGPYLLKMDIEGNSNHFLAIENHWFRSAGNTETRWAYGGLGEQKGKPRESGITIVELDLEKAYLRREEQLYRHAPERTPDGAFQPGDVFNKCFTSTCIHITPLDGPGEQVRVSVSVTDVN